MVVLKKNRDHVVSWFFPKEVCDRCGSRMFPVKLGVESGNHLPFNKMEYWFCNKCTFGKRIK